MEEKESGKGNSTHDEEKKKSTQIFEQEFDLSNRDQTDTSILSLEMKKFIQADIMAYEEKIRNAKCTTVYELINMPSYRKFSELRDEEVETELDRIIVILLKHKIILETLCEVPQKELYRFITEELFSEEIIEELVTGVFTRFVYEDFYPNHNYEIRELSFEFFSSYLDTSSDSYRYNLTDQAYEQSWHIYFRAAFNKFDFKAFEIIEQHYDLDLKDAQVDFNCEILARPDGSDEWVSFKGPGKLHLLYENGFWCVDSVELPTPKSVLLIGQ